MQIESDHPLQFMDRNREAFASDTCIPDIRLSLQINPLDISPPGPMIFDSGMVWRLYSRGEERIFRFFCDHGDPTPYKELRTGTDYSEGTIVLHRPWPGREIPDPLEYPLDELLMIHRLGQGLGVELHACGIIDASGRGWVFTGHSGAGKSTLARLWQGQDMTILSDDRIILRDIGGELRIFGTPWHGEAGFAVAADAPLAGVFVIEHGPRNEIETLSSSTAISELMARAFVPFHDAEALGTAVGLFSTLTQKQLCHRFRFTPENSAINTLLDWMKGGSNA